MNKFNRKLTANYNNFDSIIDSKSKEYNFCKECSQLFYSSEIHINIYGNIAEIYCSDCIDRYSTFTKRCTCCESEVELLDKNEVQACPNCESEIYPCSQCNLDNVSCSNCRFNSNITVDRAMKNIISGYLVRCSRFEYLSIDRKLNYRLIGSSEWSICNIGLSPFESYSIIK